MYVIEATAKPLSWHQRIGGDGVLIPKRILYIDSEGWFITASDQYDGQGKLWKTIATFNTYNDHPVADAKVAIYPFKRMFQTALVDEDIQDGFSSVVYMPGHESDDRESWYINMGVVTKAFLDPHQMQELRALIYPNTRLGFRLAESPLLTSACTQSPIPVGLAEEVDAPSISSTNSPVMFGLLLSPSEVSKFPT